jgi:siroheme decarboxylase
MAHSTHADSLDTIDRQLLNLLQSQFPLVREPFAALGEAVGIDESECLRRIAGLRGERKVIRQISAIFDTAALGYESSVINAHPGVSHNYQRPGRFNLWYTLAVGPNSGLGLEATVRKLHELSGATVTRLLPTLRLFKIGVRFDMSADGRSDSADDNAFTEADRALAAQYPIGEADQAIIRALQQDLPLEPRPFDRWAIEAGITVEKLLTAGQKYLQRKQMRRFAAVLHHRAAGAKANVMGVWAAPDDQVEQLGRRLAEFAAVSHCYQRPAYEDWPYNLYTMVHAGSRDDTLKVLDEMQQQTGIEKRDALWSIREFKKVRVRYFTGETEVWEQQFA